MKQGEQTRDKIILSSNQLFYKHGFHKTAFSDIETETGLSKGNITYHFKTKESLLKAVFEMRINQTQNLFDKWEEVTTSAKSRLCYFIDFLLSEKSELTQFGCPNGSLAIELGKSNDLYQSYNQRVFDQIRLWLIKQFTLLGYTPKHAKSRAIELFTRAQGVCVLSHVYRDETLFENEVKLIKKQIIHRSV